MPCLLLGVLKRGIISLYFYFIFFTESYIMLLSTNSPVLEKKMPPCPRGFSHLCSPAYCPPCFVLSGWTSLPLLPEGGRRRGAHPSDARAGWSVSREDMSDIDSSIGLEKWLQIFRPLRTLAPSTTCFGFYFKCHAGHICQPPPQTPSWAVLRCQGISGIFNRKT